MVDRKTGDLSGSGAAGIAVGALVGDVEVSGRSLPYEEFVAPALMAAPEPLVVPPSRSVIAAA